MKYILKRQSFILENSSWLDSKKSEWDQSFGKLIMSFHDVISDLVEELKDKFNDKDDPNDIDETILEYMEKSFDDLKEAIRLCEEESDLTKLWNEMSLNFYLWKDEMTKTSEKLDNYNSIFKLVSEYFNVITTYITKKISGEYQDSLKGDSLDDKRQGAIDFIEDLYDKLKLRFDRIDPEEIFSMSNLSEVDSSELKLNSGDEVRYTTKDDEENIAIISHNQEDLKEETNVRLVSKSSGEQFEVDKSNLIEILPKNKSLNQEISDRLKTIKRDSDKLDKLNDYLKDIEKEEDDK